MRTFKKTCWVLLICCIGSLLSCLDCNCEQYVEKAITLVNATRANHFNNFGDVLKQNDTIVNWDYVAIRVNYKVQTIAFNSDCKKGFSIFPSAYAWKCGCESSSVYFKNIYPSEVKITTIYDLNNENLAGSTVNKLFEMPFIASDMENTKFDSLDVVNKEFYVNNISTIEDDFFLDFPLVDRNVLRNDSLQFIVETVLNTGEVFIVQTPLIRVK